MILSEVSCLVTGGGLKKATKKTTTKESSALARHPAMLCSILALVGPVYSGDGHLLNFKLKKKKEKEDFKASGKSYELKYFFFFLI